MTLGDYLRKATQALGAAGIEQPRRDAKLLLCHALETPPETLIMAPDRVIGAEDQHRADLLVARRTKREPVARILGRREFWSLPFRLAPETLDPRPDSETLIVAALDRIADRDRRFRVLDLGTGSGCLLLALLSELPHAEGLGVDHGEACLRTARQNAEDLGLSARAAFQAGNWARGLTSAWDVVLCNPPYLRSDEIDALGPEVAWHEPRPALDGGADGLSAYRQILPEVPGLLSEQGFACFEIGLGQGPAVASLATAWGLATTSHHRDLARIERCLIMALSN